MNDLISRQAAIDAIRAMQTYKLFAGDDQILVDQAGVQTELMMLPSAEPEKVCIAKITLSEEQIREAAEKAKSEIVQVLPSAGPERKKGRWIRNDNGTYSCSVCQSWIPEEQHYYARYCLYCGADMREGEQDE